MITNTIEVWSQSPIFLVQSCSVGLKLHQKSRWSQFANPQVLREREQVRENNANTLTRTDITCATHAMYCNTLQHTATHCNTLQHTANRLQRTDNTLATHAMYCNTLQHTATHCSTLQHTTTHCQHTTTHCQHTFNTRHVLQHTATYCNIPKRTATH